MADKKHIVLVEDDELIRENYTDLLSDEGYRVTAFDDRSTAYQHIIIRQADLAIIDIGLGRERDGGIRLCQQIRQQEKKLPIIFLTSLDDDSDRIRGMQCEIDDYIVKGASIEYLIVRIATLLNRVDSLTDASSANESVVQQGNLQLDQQACMAFWLGERVEISLTQFWMLQELALRPGTTKSPSKLMSVANMVVEPNTIAANIKSIRKAFRDIDPGFEHIKAVYGHGYRWVERTGL